MHIHTIEDNFDFQIKRVIARMLKDYKDDHGNEMPDVETFNNWIWNERKALGEFVYEAFDTHCGIDETIQEIFDGDMD